MALSKSGHDRQIRHAAHRPEHFAAPPGSGAVALGFRLDV